MKRLVIAAPSDREFLNGYYESGAIRDGVSSSIWLQRVNATLAQRFPALFSTDASAFPLDVIMVFAFQGSGNVRNRSLYEAWLLGLPDHATITFQDACKACAVFKAERGWTDPYDAIAASLFKLSTAQWDRLEPANPNDHSWRKE